MFSIGSENTKEFCHIGLNLKQHEDNSITTDQKEYVNKSVKPIKLSINHADEQLWDPVIDPDRTQLLCALDQLNWLSGMTRLKQASQ